MANQTLVISCSLIAKDSETAVATRSPGKKSARWKIYGFETRATYLKTGLHIHMGFEGEFETSYILITVAHFIQECGQNRQTKRQSGGLLLETSIFNL